VTFGVAPERTATEYGYISPGELIFRRGFAALRNSSRSRIRRTAAEYIKAGYLSGTAATSCFAPPSCSMNTASSMPKACRPSRPSVVKAGRDPRICNAGFRRISDRRGPSPSITPVMEQTLHAAVIPVACGWSDVGLPGMRVWELSGKDSHGNAAQGKGRVRGFPRNCNVSTDQGAGRAWKGVDDLVVVATQDAVLVSRARRMPTA